MSSANDRARKAAQEKAFYSAQLSALEKNRQAIINPYEGMKDLSGMLSNPYANLGVATKAAEFEAEQVDLSLANTLDALKETGASAGGATALANAALKSKQGISANIEQQEAQNEKLRAQGQSELQQMKMAEAQRIQQAEAAGKQFVFSATEGREQQQIDRTAALMGGATMQQGQAQADYAGALTGMIGGVTSTIGSMASSGAFKKDTTADTNPFSANKWNY
jgi:phosphoglycolate phosphatase-like HAD superfamily hydrolase